MKKTLFFKILYLFLVLIVIAGASVFATSTYLSARDVSYGSTNVEDALNGLFTLKGNDENYSTDEKIVGKWIDGKNIYRKIFIKEFPNQPYFYKDNSIYGEEYDLKDLDILIDSRVISTGNHTQNQENNIWISARYANTTVKESYVLQFRDNYGGVSRLIAIFEYTKK